MSNVKRENANRAKSRVKAPMPLHFVVSNVPDLDDEEGIVGRTLKKFEETLQYGVLAGQIHHYDSLSLLNQEVFSEGRPNSRLTREYKLVKESIVRENLADRDAALAFVERTAQELWSPKANSHYSLNLEKVESIQVNFPNDSEISLHIALIYESIGRTSDALNLLASQSGGKSAHFYAIRARLHQRVGQRDEAAVDLETMLNSEGAEAASLLGALSIVPQVKPELFSALAESRALLSLDKEQRLFVAMQLEDGALELSAKASILESVFDTSNTLLSHQLALISIGLGRFDRAVALLNPKTGNPTEIGNAFNLAMAKLGRDGRPDIDLLKHVIDLDAGDAPSEPDANYAFCLAIANYATDNREKAQWYLEVSRSQLKARGRRDFSPWTYTRVAPSDFADHLSELERQMARKILHPAFMDA